MTKIKMKKLRFSGHESFICKQFWLKKGYDFLNQHNQFSDNDSVIKLGVGKNMVSSIRFWMKAFGLTDQDDNLQEIASFIFDDSTGKDPYLEDLGTIWLLHYQLIKTNYASIYHLYFNNFNTQRYDFTKDQLQGFLKRKIEDIDPNIYNQNTIKNDIAVFIRNYLKLKKHESKLEIEENFSGLLLDLNIFNSIKVKDFNGNLEDHYILNNYQNGSLPFQIILYSILDNPNYGKSISLKQLQTSKNCPSFIFSINNDTLNE
ncbi:DUF4007 family protein, partial [bacterium]|nr:DUF4007 family protein [bacterium]